MADTINWPIPVTIPGREPINASSPVVVNRPWGVSPATFEVQFPYVIEHPPFLDSANEPIEITFPHGPITIVGILVEAVDESDVSGGMRTKITMVDRRERFQRYAVKCQLNIIDQTDRPGDVYQILPDGYAYDPSEGFIADPTAKDWTWQKKTYISTSDGVSVPVLTRHILDWLCKDICGFTATEYQGAAASLVADPDAWLPNLDCNNGRKVGAFLTDILDQLGLTLGLKTDQTTIAFCQKGEIDTAPSGGNWERKSEGKALANFDDNIEIIGDKNLYQINEYSNLERDWNNNYEAYVVYSTFKARALELIDQYGSDKYANRHPNSLTLEEWDDLNGGSQVWLDNGLPYGRIARNLLPVWFYICHFVFRAFKFPDVPFSKGPLAGIPIQCLLPLNHSLIADPDAEGYPETLIEETKGRNAIVKSSSVTLDADHQHRLIWAKSGYNPVEHWTLNLATGQLMFSPDQPSVENAEELVAQFTTYTADKEQITVQAAKSEPKFTVKIPKITCVFSADRFTFQKGNGSRRGVYYERALRKHFVMDATNETAQEMKIVGGKTADEMAEKFADNLLNFKREVLSGRYERRGILGTELDSRYTSIDSSVTEEGGAQERLNFAHEKSPTPLVLPRRLIEQRAYPRQLPPELQRYQEELKWEQLKAQLDSDHSKAAQPKMGIDEGKGGGANINNLSRARGSEWKICATDTPSETAALGFGSVVALDGKCDSHGRFTTLPPDSYPSAHASLAVVTVDAPVQTANGKRIFDAATAGTVWVKMLRQSTAQTACPDWVVNPGNPIYFDSVNNCGAKSDPTHSGQQPFAVAVLGADVTDAATIREFWVLCRLLTPYAGDATLWGISIGVPFYGDQDYLYETGYGQKIDDAGYFIYPPTSYFYGYAIVVKITGYTVEPNGNQTYGPFIYSAKPQRLKRDENGNPVINEIGEHDPLKQYEFEDSTEPDIIVRDFFGATVIFFDSELPDPSELIGTLWFVMKIGGGSYWTFIVSPWEAVA